MLSKDAHAVIQQMLCRTNTYKEEGRDKECMEALLVKPNRVYTASTNYSRKGIFAHLYIRYVKRQRLGDMSDEDAILEGFSSLDEFRDVLMRCYGRDSWDPMLEVYVIGFRVVDVTVATTERYCRVGSPQHLLLPLQSVA